MSYQGFVANEDAVDGVLYNLIVAGEIAESLPNAVRRFSPEVGWDDLIAAANTALADYDRSDLNAVWRLCTEKVPALLVALTKGDVATIDVDDPQRIASADTGSGVRPRRDTTIRLLQEHRAELRREKVGRVRLFGSVARDTATPSSDIDLLVETDGSKGLLVLAHLQFLLEDLLGHRVDVLLESELTPPLASTILPEAILVF